MKRTPVIAAHQLTPDSANTASTQALAELGLLVCHLFKMSKANILLLNTAIFWVTTIYFMVTIRQFRISRKSLQNINNP